MNHLLDREFSLPTVNWLRFGAPPGGVGDPEPVWPLEAVLDGAAAAGFTRVGLDLYTVRDYLARGGRIGDIVGELRSRGLACTDVGVLPLGATDVGSATEALAELASSVDAPTCIASLYAAIDRPRAIAEVRRCGEILAPAGARIALEFVAYFGLTRLSEAVAICAAAGWERCGLLVDTWHFFRSGAPWPELRSLRGDQIALVHVNDGPLEGDGDPVAEGRTRRRPPGGGSFPLPAFAAALAATGYRGTLGVEVLSDELRTRPPADGAWLLMEALQEHWPP